MLRSTSPVVKLLNGLPEATGFVNDFEIMKFLDLTLPTATENVALDEALLLHAEEQEGDEILRFWESSSLAVVLGAGCRLADDVDEAACRADGVPILRRSSGGGTVLLGCGCLCFSLVLAYERDAALREVRSSYRCILERIAQALGPLQPGVKPSGVSDLAIGTRKFSGNAQQRKRRFLLHHGTLLYDFEIGRVVQYLRPPPRQPEYRGGRSHDAFLINLSLHADELRRRLRDAWSAKIPSLAWPRELTQRLVEEKYRCPSWITRR
jgi:lipoate-protein ligase A